MMRAARLLSALMLLQARGRLTAQELADRLEVSVRTIYRDVSTLQRAGVPIYSEFGPSGGYQLVAGYTTRLTGLTGAEADALFLSGMPGPAAELGLGAAMAAAQLKLHAALPADLRERSGRILDRFHLDPGPWYRDDGDRLPQLPAIAAAVWDQRRLQVRYRRWKNPSDVTRTIDPHGLVLKAGTWYLVARGGTRLATYRVSQMRALKVLEQHFSRQADFDLAQYWDAYLADFNARRHTSHATIRLSPVGRERIRTWVDDAVVTAVLTTTSSPGPDGWVTTVIPIESIAHAHGELLKLGAEVEVLHPLALRSRLKRSASALADLYG